MSSNNNNNNNNDSHTLILSFTFKRTHSFDRFLLIVTLTIMWLYHDNPCTNVFNFDFV